MRFALAVLAVLPVFAQSDSPPLSALNPGVVRPATPREFAATVLGGSETAMSMDIAPYWLAFGHLVDRRTYKANPVLRLLAGIDVSLATAPSDQGEPSRLAAGALLRIFDAGDPRLDDVLADCLERVAERVLAYSPPCREGADCTDENTRREALLKNICRDQARARNWNRSSWAVGAARESQSTVAWSSLAYGFEGVPGLESTSQFIVQWSRRDNVSIGGLQLRMGGPDTHVSLEWTGSRGESRYSVAAERRVGEKLWLEMTIGGASAKEIFLLTAFHWGLAEK